MSTFVGVSEAASLALHSMALLASTAPGRASTRELARRLGGSEAHLSKVLQRLERAGLVRARRGPGGGYELAAPASRVTLKQVYESVEGAIRPTICLLPKRICEGECLLGDVLRELDSKIGGMLARTSLASLEGFASGSARGSKARAPRRTGKEA